MRARTPAIRIAVWVCCGNVPTALSQLMQNPRDSLKCVNHAAAAALLRSISRQRGFTRDYQANIGVHAASSDGSGASGRHSYRSAASGLTRDARAAGAQAARTATAI